MEDAFSHQSKPTVVHSEEVEWRNCVVANFKMYDKRILQLEICLLLTWAAILASIWSGK